MRTSFLKLVCCAAAVAGIVACAQTRDYASYVDPMIGTGGHGHTFPGAIVPHGMIQPSPDTRIYQWDACSGYHYSDSTINGFSHTHLSGTGCGDYGDILIMPTVGEQDYHPMGLQSQRLAYASGFSHDNETAEPGYYSVLLDRYGVKAELTATERTALHCYTFPASDESGFIVDLDYSLQNQQNFDMQLDVLSDTELAGGKMTKFWAFDQYIYFYVKFSKPFTCTIIDDSVAMDEGGAELPRKKALLRFSTADGEKVYAKIGISAVDAEGARRNAETEIPAWDFDKVRRDARQKWNEWLGRIDIKTTDEALKPVFYTAMYHTAVSPTIFMDVDGRYRGMDMKVHQGDLGKPVYTVFSLWDTFRALHPLMTIMAPSLNNQFVASLVKKYEEGGILPMWDLASNYTGTMIAYNAVPVIVDSYIKGNPGLDVETAFKACLKSAEYDTTGIVCPRPVLPFLVPAAKYYKNTIGYVPCDKDNEAVAKALEFAYDDWCISEFAKQIGDTVNYEKYKRFGQGYKTYFDPQMRFMRGVDSKGQWRTPFNPRASEHRSDDYCEGTAWQWTWFVPHDVDGLVSLMGGREGFISKLDSLFTADSQLEGSTVSVDISGLIGQYAHGNEPSHHIIHLYNYVDEPWKTQNLIDSVLYNQYFHDPDGVSGNEDCGQMSAWYILNSMGFYQVCPGRPIYSIGRPIFDEVTVNLEGGKKFRVVVRNNSRRNKYIKSAKMNGVELTQPFFNHSDIMGGGTLEIEMTDQPTTWGVEKKQI